MELDLVDPLRRLWFFATANADFGQSLYAAEQALAAKDREQRRAFAEVAAIRYARPFGRCVLPKLNPTDAETTGTRLPKSYLPDAPGVEDFHDRIMQSRHSIFAHTEIEHKPAQVKRRTDANGQEHWTVKVQLYSLDEATLGMLAKMARALTERMASELAVLAAIHLPGLTETNSAAIYVSK